MDRVTTYVNPSPVLSADLNTIQDNALGIAQLNGYTIGTLPRITTRATTIVDVSFCGPFVIGNKYVQPFAGGTSNVGTLAVNSWYYVYAFDAGSGVAGIEYNSTTVPDARLQYKNGTNTHLYLGCYRTNAAGIVVHATYVNRQCLYDLSNRGSNSDIILNAGNSTAIAAVSCVNHLPPHARILIAEFQLRALTLTGAFAASVFKQLAGTVAQVVMNSPGASGGSWARYDHLITNVFTNSNRDIHYQVTNIAADLTIYSRGFIDCIT